MSLGVDGVSVVNEKHEQFVEYTDGLGAQRQRVFPAILNTSRFIRNEIPVENTTMYDAIIIGGGGAGCPFARTLAEVGLRVLLIERGRTRQESPVTLDVSGVGKSLSDPLISQLVVTKEGVRSHVANLLSGGTGINVGIFILEQDAYIDTLESIPGVSIDRKLFRQATNWTTNLFAHPSQQVTPAFYENVWQNTLESIAGPYINDSLTLQVNHTWRSYSLFDESNGGYRHAADLTLGPPFREFPLSLDVLINYVVDKIEFNGTRATCVILHKTTFNDIAPIVPEHLQKDIGLTHHVLDYFNIINRFNKPKGDFKTGNNNFFMKPK